MRQKQFFQCQECGCVHYIEMEYNIDEEMYIERICVKCGKPATHLWVGNDPSDYYLYADVYLDERYFIY